MSVFNAFKKLGQTLQVDPLEEAANIAGQMRKRVSSNSHANKVAENTIKNVSYMKESFDNMPKEAQKIYRGKQAEDYKIFARPGVASEVKEASKNSKKNG